MAVSTDTDADYRFCGVSLTEAPDGALYVLISTRDGGGSPRAGDDRVLRVVPPAG